MKHVFETQYDRDIENKIENLRIKECSLKNRLFCKLVLSLETFKTLTVTSGFISKNQSFLKII